MDFYRQWLTMIEEALETALFDAALAEAGDAVPFTEAVAEIDRDRSTE